MQDGDAFFHCFLDLKSAIHLGVTCKDLSKEIGRPIGSGPTPS